MAESKKCLSDEMLDRRLFMASGIFGGRMAGDCFRGQHIVLRCRVCRLRRSVQSHVDKVYSFHVFHNREFQVMCIERFTDVFLAIFCFSGCFVERLYRPMLFPATGVSFERRYKPTSASSHVSTPSKLPIVTLNSDFVSL